MYGGVQTYEGVWTYGGIQMHEVYRHMGTYVLGGIQMYGVYEHRGGLWMFGAIVICGGVQMYGNVWTWGPADTPHTYRQPGIIPTCLPTSPEEICKKFFSPLIMSHFHHLITEMEGKKPTKCLNACL